MERGERRRLDGESLTLSHRHGAGMVLLGAATLVIGAVALLQGLGVSSPGRLRMPLWAAAWVGGVFSVAGLFAIGSGAMRLRARARRRRAAAAHPDEPCYADYPWQSEGIADDNPRRILRGFGALGLVSVLLVPLHGIAEPLQAGPGVLVLLLGAADLVALFGFAAVLHRLVRWLRHGRGRLRWTHFPLRPGERLDLELELATDFAMGDELRCELRFVEEVLEQRGAHRDRHSVLVRYALWTSRSRISLPRRLVSDAGRIALCLELPADRPDLTNAIAASPGRYWELAVHFTTGGVDYSGRFPLPVYAPAEEPSSHGAPRALRC